MDNFGESGGGFFSGERFKKQEIDHRFGGHYRIFYCGGGHLNGHFLGFFKRSPLKNPPLVRLCAVWPMENWLGSVLTTVR